MKVLIVGTGLTGSVVARKLADSEIKVTVIDQRSNIGGNCYIRRDEKTNYEGECICSPIFFIQIMKKFEIMYKQSRFI